MNLTSKFLSNKSWNKYKKIIKDFIDKDAGRQVVTWMRHIDQIGAFGEDGGDQYLPVQLEALCYYNVFRVNRKKKFIIYSRFVIKTRNITF